MKTQEIEDPPNRGSSSPRPKPAGGAVAVLLLLGFAAANSACVALAEDPDPDLIAAITQAVGGVRIIEPRLGGTFEHQSCQPSAPGKGVQKPDCGSPSAPARTVARARSLLADTLQRDADAGALYASGLWDLLWHEVDRGIDRSISKLHGAVAMDPADAEMVNSLAAAYVVRAQDQNRPIDLFKALELAEQAVSLDPASSPSLFNHALVLERLFLYRRAIQAWDRYLAVEISDPWAAEARAARDRLAAELASPDGVGLLAPLPVGRAGERRLASLTATHDAIVQQHLPHWAELVLRDEKGPARELLQKIGETAAAIFERSGDSLLQEEVFFLRELRDAQNRRSVARAYVRLADGIETLKNLEVQPAIAMLEAARTQLAEIGSPLAELAEYHLLVCHYQDARYEQVLRRTAAWIARLDSDRSILSMRLHSIGALVYGLTAKHHDAIASYSDARAIAERIGDRDSSARLELALGELNATIGATRAAWRNRYRALSLSAARVRPLTVVPIRSTIAEAAARLGFRKAALYLADESVLASRELPGAVYAFALDSRARNKIADGDMAGALADLNRSRLQLVHVGDDGVRAIIEDDINLLVGQAIVETHPLQASELLAAVDEHFEGRGQAIMSVPAKRALATAQFALGRTADAGSTLEGALEVLEEQSSTLRTPEQRLGFASQARATLDRLIVLRALELHDPPGALDVILRAQHLAAEPSAGVDGPPASGSIRSHDEEVRVVVYRVLTDGIFAWIVAPEATRFRRLETNGDQLRRAVRRLQAAVTARHGRAIRAELSWLYDALIAPIRDLLDETSELRVVPDRALHQVPFGALLDEATGEFLIESHAVVVAPYEPLTANAVRQVQQTPASVLVVADPVLGPDVAGRFGPLPTARAEAMRIASLYKNPTLLLGPDAHVARVREQLQGHDVVHFAVHAAPPVDDTGAGYLVLAGPREAEPPGLSASAIAGMRIVGRPIVVLAACDTAGGQLGANAGPVSLVSSFLQAGAGTVVASLWEVDDEATEPLMYKLHQELLAGARPAYALRSAQLAALHQNEGQFSSIAQWAAFQVYVGPTP